MRKIKEFFGGIEKKVIVYLVLTVLVCTSALVLCFALPAPATEADTIPVSDSAETPETIEQEEPATVNLEANRERREKLAEKLAEKATSPVTTTAPVTTAPATTVAPTTSAPTTEAPTTAAPTTAAPTTEAYVEQEESEEPDEDVDADAEDEEEVVYSSGERSMELTSPCGLSEDELNRGLLYNLKGHAADFLAAEREYGVNALFLASIAALESGWGRSELALYKNNLYGWKGSGGYMSFDSMYSCIFHVARALKNNYLTPGGSCFRGYTLEDVGYTYCETSTWPGMVRDIMWMIRNAA